MNVTVNGRVRELSADTTVEQLIESETGSTRGSAAVVDGEVVPRSTWPHTPLRAGQDVEIVTAVQGG